MNTDNARVYSFYGDDGREYDYDYFFYGKDGQERIFHVVATCSYGDLEAIKKVLNDRALDDGHFIIFELVRRWGSWFLTGIDGVGGRVWQVCPEWFTENGGGFDW